MIKELVTYISTEASLTIGTDIHAGWFPQDELTTGTAVMEFGGAPQVLTGTGRGQAMFEIYTRGATYHTARDAAMAIYEVLRIKGKVVLPTITSGDTVYVVEQMIPEGRPQHIGEDEKRRHEFTFTLHCYIKEA